LVVNTSRVNPFSEGSYLAINGGNGSFTASLQAQSSIAAVADFNGDGNADFFVHGFISTSFCSILFGDGAGNILFTGDALNRFSACPQGRPTDFDHNGTIDLVTNSTTYFPGNGHGGFGDAITFSTTQANVIAIADLNGDGRPDLVLQNNGTTDVFVFLNNVTTPSPIAASTFTGITTSAATTSVGLPVTVVANVISNGGVPVGTVAFTDGTTALGNADVNIYGNVALSTSFSTGGLHNISATFTGALDSSTNTAFGNSNTNGPAVSVNNTPPANSPPSVTLTASPNPVRQLNQVILGATVSSTSGTPTGSVLFQADGNALGIQPVGGQLRVTFPTAGHHNVQARYGGDANFPQATSATVVEDVSSLAANFSLTSSPQSATIKAGQTATFTLTVSPAGGFNSMVSFNCMGLPANSSCTFTPPTVTPNGAPVSTMLTIQTSAPQAAAASGIRPPSAAFAWPAAIAFTLGLLSLVNPQTRKRAQARMWIPAGVLLLFSFFFFLAGCGSGSSPSPNPHGGTPPGTSSITAVATSSTNHTAVLSLTVTP
jgi:hypothetical protein